MSDEAAPGWGAVLLGVAVGSAVGYSAARRGLWGAREEHDAELNEAARDAWWTGYDVGYGDGAWAGHTRGRRGAELHAARVGERERASAYLKGFETRAQVESLRARDRTATRPGHG